MKKPKDLPSIMDFVVHENGKLLNKTIRRRIYFSKKHGCYINIAGFKVRFSKHQIPKISIHIPNMRTELEKANDKLEKIYKEQNKEVKLKKYKDYK